jgi:transcriptional regulator with XRE-family HTH domain
MLLEAGYASRRARNPKYSLRSYARYLGIDHSTLSQILRGKRALTDAMMARLGARLGLSDELIGHYMMRKGRGGVSAADITSAQLSIDTFEVIGDWCHFALLELTRVEGFKPDSRWIARALGISVNAVNMAIVRLVRLGLLVMSSHEMWEDRSGNVTLDHEALTEVALKQLHRQAHELAIESIERTPAELRDQASITVALSSRRLPEIAALVAKFRRELERIAARDDVRDDVYMVDVSVFPLTTLNRDKETRHAQSSDPLADAHA